MRAIVQRAYGRPGAVLEVADVDRPEPGPREALVRVAAAGVSIGIWHLVTGIPYMVRLFTGLRRPKVSIPGLDVAGTVEAVGADVDWIEVGDAVVGWRDGTYAEHVCVAEDQLLRKPKSLSFEEAVALGDSAITALKAVRDQGRVGAGDRVVVNGASGGVGTYAVQIAKHLGAEVTAVCGAAGAELVRSLGADATVDYRAEDFTRVEGRFDVLIDLIGNRTLRECRRTLARRGTYVLVGVADAGRILGVGRQVRTMAGSPFVSQGMRVFVATHNADDLEEVQRLAASGEIRPVIEESYPLERAADALDRQGSGRVKGKLTLVVEPG